MTDFPTDQAAVAEHDDAPVTSSKVIKPERQLLAEAVTINRIPGVYGGFIDKFPIGALMEKGLTVRSGQTHVQKYLRPLYAAIAEGEIDSTFLISHRMALEEGPTGYKKFHDEQDRYTKIVLKPQFA